MPLPKKRLEIALLILLIVIAAFFRLYRLRDYVVFLGDEGRDMIVLRDIFVKGHIPFLGPSASVGGFYLGPIYYWMAAPFLALSLFDPVGPSYMVALFGLATVLLLFKFIKEAAGFWPAFLVSLLYATTPLVVRYSRSSWNPNPLPFFSLLLIYLTYLGIKKNRPVYFLGAGACFGVAIQLHYLALVLAPLALIIVLVNQNYKKIPTSLIFAFVGALITFSPFLIFEIRHNFPNIKTILEFVTRGNTITYKNFNLIYTLSNSGNIFLEALSSVTGTIITRLAFWTLTILGLLSLALNFKDKEKRFLLSIGLIYFLVGIFLIRLYAGQLYDYYYGSIFPAPFLLLGFIIMSFWKKLPLKLIWGILVIFILFYFISHGFYTHPPNKLIKQTETVANFVIEKSENQPFNFALISNSNSDHAYRYFLDIKNHEPIPLEQNIAEQLIIVCESKVCSPLGNPLWEIAAFGRGEIAGEWELPAYGFKVYRLTHWTGEPSPAGKPAKKLGYIEYLLPNM